MKNKKKQSIQYQIFVWVGLVIILIILINLIFNNFIMERIYLERQQVDLKNIYNTISQQNITEEELKEIYQLCNIRNITLFTTDKDYNPIFYNYDNTGKDSEEELLEHIKNFSKGSLYSNIEDIEIIEETSTYKIVKIVDYKNNLTFLELRNKNAENNILLRISIESISSSVSLFNTFSSFVLLIGLAIGLAFSWTLGKKFAAPLKRLSNISEEMINLNFNSKYEEEVNSEIDTLGNNFNELSNKLSLSIKELKEVNAQLEKDIEEKEKINSIMKDFIGNVSHELKTPIALIQGYAEAIKDEIGGDKETNDYYADIIVEESQRMNKLVKQLIDLNQLESGQFLDLEDFDLCILVKDIVDGYSKMAKDKKTRIDVELKKSSIMVYSDEFKIEQVLINYITNAFNHLDDNKKIRVKVFDVGERVRVEVFNSGANIPEEEIPNIWLKFYKVDKAHTRNYGGSGIGLSIVKAIMESLEEDFGVINNDDGVTFYFTIKKSINTSEGD